FRPQRCNLQRRDSLFGAGEADSGPPPDRKKSRGDNAHMKTIARAKSTIRRNSIKSLIGPLRPGSASCVHDPVAGRSTRPLENLALRGLAKDVAGVIEREDPSPAIVAGHAFGHLLAKMLAVDDFVPLFRSPDLTKSPAKGYGAYR